MSVKSGFRGPFKKQNGKGDQKVLKSEWHHFVIIIDQCEGNWVPKSLS